MVPNTSELLPEPDTPVNTVRRRLGSSTLMSLRLFSRAPCTRIRSWLSAAGDCASGLVALLIVSPPWGGATTTLSARRLRLLRSMPAGGAARFSDPAVLPARGPRRLPVTCLTMAPTGNVSARQPLYLAKRRGVALLPDRRHAGPA